MSFESNQSSGSDVDNSGKRNDSISEDLSVEIKKYEQEPSTHFVSWLAEKLLERDPTANLTESETLVQFAQDLDRNPEFAGHLSKHLFSLGQAYIDGRGKLMSDDQIRQKIATYGGPGNLAATTEFDIAIKFSGTLRTVDKKYISIPSNPMSQEKIVENIDDKNIIGTKKGGLSIRSSVDNKVYDTGNELVMDERGFLLIPKSVYDLVAKEYVDVAYKAQENVKN